MIQYGYIYGCNTTDSYNHGNASAASGDTKVNAVNTYVHPRAQCDSDIPRVIKSVINNRIYLRNWRSLLEAHLSFRLCVFVL